MTSSARVPRTLKEVAASFFSFGSPRLLAAQALGGIAVRALLGPPVVGDLVVAVGVAAYWPLQEWALHRMVLHARPMRVGRFVFDNGAARAHRRHHDDPTCPRSTLLPTWLIAALVPLHVLGWTALAPTSALACTGVLCLGAAALSYEWIHLLTHTAYRPRTAWFREVKRRHLAHHYRDSSRWFAFAVPAVDDWLGTGQRRERAPRHVG